MSNERPPAVSRRQDGGRTDAMGAIDATLDRLTASRGRIVRTALALALVAVAALTTLRIARNLPFDPVSVPSAIVGLATTAVPAVVALALVAVALASRRDAVRVGLLFAGVFALLATVDRAAALPAIVAVVGGFAAALAGVLGRPSGYRDWRLMAVAAAIVLGVAVSLASTAGLLAASARGLGGLLFLAGVTGLGVRAEGDRLALAAGVLAVTGVVLASVTAPFVVGSGLLVGFAVVGVPHALVALALGGATMAVVAGLRRRARGLALGAALVIVAGVPATVPAAAAVTLGATLALGSIDGVVTAPDDTVANGREVAG